MEISEKYNLDKKKKWAWISGFENKYAISNYGDVFSVASNKLLKGKIDKDGYIEFALYSGKRELRFCRRGHRLVAIAFVSNPNNLPIINHKNHSRSDNHEDNLEWCTNQYNIKYSYDAGRLRPPLPFYKGKTNGESPKSIKIKLTEANGKVSFFPTITQGAKYLGASNNSLNSWAFGKSKSRRGVTVEYLPK